MTDDLGYFGPGSVTWRVLADPAVGGVRALFLQALHPLAMAGVNHHSDFKTAFWPRLQRIAQYVTTVGFGTRAQVDAAATRVRAVDRTVRGVDPVTGGRYAATDPDLLRWVHVTKVASFLEAVGRGGLPLTGAEADQFFAEQSVPRSWWVLKTYQPTGPRWSSTSSRCAPSYSPPRWRAWPRCAWRCRHCRCGPS